LLQQFAAAERVQVWLQPGGPASIEPLEPGSQPDDLWYALPDYDIQLAFGPLDFIQVNQDMNQRMITQAMQLAVPQSHERVLDLFCGIGNFSLALARLAGEVVGIELDPAMVRKAQSNAERNKLTNARFHAVDLAAADVLGDRWGKDFDLVVIDPPRAGAQEVLPQVAATGARRILYVSCHPGTLARDAGILCSAYGYKLSAAGAMDMFPQTSHVEAMALFERDRPR
jgi:23S rRNA (uracil1939-C5)-methyltransferase